MLRRFLYIGAVVLLFLSACAKPQPGEEYFPEPAKGSTWEYMLKWKVADGKILKGRMMVRIVGEEFVDGKTYYKTLTVISGIPGVKPSAVYSRRTKEGIYKKDPNKPEYIATPFPISVGSKWTMQTPDGKIQFAADRTDTVKLFEKNEYRNSLKILFSGERQAKHIEGYSYFAPGVGEIMTHIAIGDTILEYGLDKYKL